MTLNTAYYEKYGFGSPRGKRKLTFSARQKTAFPNPYPPITDVIPPPPTSGDGAAYATQFTIWTDIYAYATQNQTLWSDRHVFQQIAAGYLTTKDALTLPADPAAYNAVGLWEGVVGFDTGTADSFAPPDAKGWFAKLYSSASPDIIDENRFDKATAPQGFHWRFEAPPLQASNLTAVFGYISADDDDVIVSQAKLAIPEEGEFFIPDLPVSDDLRIFIHQEHLKTQQAILDGIGGISVTVTDRASKTDSSATSPVFSALAAALGAGAGAALTNNAKKS